jgi:hypothetical protein
VRQVSHGVKPPVQARAEKHARHQPRPGHESARVLDIAAEVKRGG